MFAECFEGAVVRRDEYMRRLVILKQNCGPDGTNRAQIASSAFVFVRDDLFAASARADWDRWTSPENATEPRTWPENPIAGSYPASN